MKAFLTKSATSGGTALPLAELKLNDSIALRRMVLTAILRKAGPDRYFLDEVQWATKRRLGGGKLLRIALVFGLALIAMALYAVGK